MCQLFAYLHTSCLVCLICRARGCIMRKDPPPFAVGRLEPPSIKICLETPRVSTPNTISIRSADLCRVHARDEQTDCHNTDATGSSVSLVRIACIDCDAADVMKHSIGLLATSPLYARGGQKTTGLGAVDEQ